MFADILLALAIFGALVGIVSGVAMTCHVHDRGVKVNWFLLKLFLPKYVHHYRRLTVAETGRVGPLFLPFVLGMNGALVCGVAGLALRG